MNTEFNLQIKNLVNHSLIQRLREIVKARYGIEIEMELGSSHASEGLQTPFVGEGALRIPFLFGQNQLISIVLEQVENISQNERDILVDLVRTMTERAIDQVLAWESNNVISLASFRHQRDLDAGFIDIVPDYSPVDAPIQEKFKTKWATSKLGTWPTVVFMPTESLTTLQKVVSEVHSLSGNMACLPFEQIASSINSVGDLCTLNSATIVVQDLLNFDSKMIGILAEFCELSQNEKLDQGQQEDLPMLIISSRSGLPGLIDQKIIPGALANFLKNSILEIDRLPIERKKLVQALELFLEPAIII